MGLFMKHSIELVMQNQAYTDQVPTINNPSFKTKAITSEVAKQLTINGCGGFAVGVECLS